MMRIDHELMNEIESWDIPWSREQRAIVMEVSRDAAKLSPVHARMVLDSALEMLEQETQHSERLYRKLQDSRLENRMAYAILFWLGVAFGLILGAVAWWPA